MTSSMDTGQGAAEEIVRGRRERTPRRLAPWPVPSTGRGLARPAPRPGIHHGVAGGAGLRRRSRGAPSLAAGFLVVTLGVAALGCAPAPGQPGPGFVGVRDDGAIPDLVAARRQVAEYIASGRYEADIASVVADARAYLEARARTASRLAVVLDIDETSLSNLTALEANAWGYILDGPCHLPRGPCGIVRWIEMARAEPIRPVRGLAVRARQLGAAVFFITGRAEWMRAATERNLRAAGYEWDGLVLQPDDQHLPSAADFKAPERKRIADRGYTIAVNVGDQISDLAGGHAERAYKLPNPIYVIP